MNVNFLASFQRLFFTVKPLRFEQVWFRLWRKLYPLRKLNSINTAIAPLNWVWSAPEVMMGSIIDEHHVCFLNHRGEVRSAVDWNDPSHEKLWLYNLHYFDDLNAVDSLSRKSSQLSLVNRWIIENPPVSGNGWEPYPLSLRLVNWIKWYNRAELDDPEIINSIQQQAEALSKQLEYHILGNHLFSNAKALVFVGCFLQGDQAARALQLGLNILKREIPEQFLSDGGHFELSPMYHCILLWDLLDLINLAKTSANSSLTDCLSDWEQFACRALDWLKVMIHPDGEVSFFNDSTIGIAASPTQIFDYAASLGLATTIDSLPSLLTLPCSGYSRISMLGHTTLFDHANVGPDYLPGHAHADTLSVEWSVGDERVVVNSGTSIYGLSSERLRQRQTAAHSTVEVNGKDSSEVWSGFRVARRAYGRLVSFIDDGNKVILSASHNGYFRRNKPVIHNRTLTAEVQQLKVEDSLDGKPTTAIAYFHLHPDVSITQIDSCRLLLSLNSGKNVILNSSEPIKVLPSTWHPGFGKEIVSTKVVIPFSCSELTTTFKLSSQTSLQV